MPRKKKTKRVEGLGDSIEQVTKATGIDKIVKFVAGEDCGCEERKNKLNSMFRYHKPECLTEEEYTYLHKWFSEHRNIISVSSQLKLLEIYNRVFKAKKEPTACSDCFRILLDELKKVYESYEIQ